MPGLYLFGRDDWIRTSGPLHPMQVRYQAALHPGSSVRVSVGVRVSEDLTNILRVLPLLYAK